MPVRPGRGEPLSGVHGADLADMDTIQRTDARAVAAAADEVASSLIIAVPFYRNEQLVEPVTRSLLACAAELRALNAEVMLFDDSPDYPALGLALARAEQAIGGALRLSVKRNGQNLGWLKTCNLAMRQAASSGADVLLLNSDTIVFPGAVTEMIRAARLDPMIGFVNPRSNNATLATLPIGERFAGLSPEEAHAAYKLTVRTMPELSYTPTAVGFALLIRRRIIAEFGVFDEAYGRGYDEENDLVMRASRCGYRSVIANRAYVWHKGEASFGAEADSKEQIQDANHAILSARYPEYDGLIEAWREGVEYRAERLLSALTPGPDGRLSIAFDFSNFGLYHSGTQKAGIQLLKSAVGWRDRFQIFALCATDVFEFHGLDRLGVQRADPHGPEMFAVIFRVGQPFNWDAMLRITLKGAVLGVFMLDTISLDSAHLRSPQLFDLWQYTISQSDFIVYNSSFTEHQFKRRFADVERRRHLVSPHSLALEDYAAPPVPTARAPLSDRVRELAEGYVLVIGNHYPHKSVGDAANRLAQAYPNLRVVALGVTREPAKLDGAPLGEHAPLGPMDDRLLDLPNLTGLRAGQLSDADMEALQRKAMVIVMPSHYEGFGLPMLSALAMHKPFVARATPALEEVSGRLGRNPNVRFFDTTADLIALMAHPPKWISITPPPTNAGDGERAASDIRRMIDAAIADARYPVILERFRVLHMIYGAAHALYGVQKTPAHLLPPDNNPDSAARRLGALVERTSRKMFHVKPVYGAMQMIYRAGRWIGLNK